MMKLRNALCALLGALSLPAFATPTLETLNYARFYSASDPRMSYACEKSNGAACQGSVAVPGTNWIAHYDAHGSSAYGILKNYAAVSLTGDASGGAFPSFLSVGSRSGFIDAYTFTGDSGTGTAYFTFSIDGTATSSNGASGGHLLQLVPARNGVLDWGAQRNYGTVDGKAVIEVPFEFGTPVEMLISFYALAQVFSWQEGASAIADYSHTAVLSQIVVRDSEGKLVDDFAITSASGTNYGATGVIPEPGSAVLLLTGLGAAAWLRRRRDHDAA
jgi:hypothetical protein